MEIYHSKTPTGLFFEDFSLEQYFEHPTPRTLTAGDAAVYQGLFGNRFAVQSCDVFARSLGYPHAPLDDFLVFHTVFGKTVPDISLNAVANLGYAGGIFYRPVFRGDSLRARSSVTGLKENSTQETGIVYVHTQGLNQNDDLVLEYHRWVMVKKRHKDSPAPLPHIPVLPALLEGEQLQLPRGINLKDYDMLLSGANWRWSDYQVGEIIHHRDGMTIEDAEHMMATRLYQNTARIHFNHHTEKESRFQGRLIYGGHIISVARSLSFNGLENAFLVAGINGGKHSAPTLAGDTIYAQTCILDKYETSHPNIGALRLGLQAFKNHNPTPQDYEAKEHSSRVLELDYWVWCLK